MNAELQKDIEQLIDNIDPASVLLIGGRSLSPPGDRTVTRIGTAEAIQGLAETGYFDLAVLIDDEDGPDKHRKEPLISGLRDIHSRRFLLAVPRADDDNNGKYWNNAELVAFGLTRLHDYGDGWRLYEYNILNYKQTPDWLNAKNWANPEMWGKYRW